MRWSWVTWMTLVQLGLDWLLRLYRDVVFADWETQRIAFLQGADMFIAQGMFNAFYGPIALFLTGSLSTDIELVHTVAFGCTLLILVGSVLKFIPLGLLELGLGIKLALALFTGWIEPFLSLGGLFTGSMIDQMIALRPFFGAGPAPILSALLGFPLVIAGSIMWSLARSSMKSRLEYDRL